MKLYLSVWPPSIRGATNPESLFVGGLDQWEALSMLRPRVLLSYHYFKDDDLDAIIHEYFGDHPPGIFADSGGFSAWSLGTTIAPSDYIAWLRRWRHLFDAYANLDVIGDPDATMRNQAILEDAGLDPIPVFHTGSPWRYLDRYLEAYPYIALGGMVPYMQQYTRLMPWLIQAFKMAEGTAVYHGFGATAWRIMAALPWYSVDSSSWAQGFRFGTMPIFNPTNGRFVKLKLGDYDTWRIHGQTLADLGYDWRDFGDRSRNERKKIAGLCAANYMAAERWLRIRHGTITLPDKPSGIRIYLAEPSYRLKDFADASASIREAQEQD